MAASAQTTWPAIMPRLKPALSESLVAAVLPAGDASVPPTSASPAERLRWLGQWSGWACQGRQCDVRIAVEDLSAEQATVAFAMADALQGQLAERAKGAFDNDELIVSFSGKRVVLRLRTDGDMEMSFWKPESQLMSVGVLTQRELQSPYTRTIESLPTPWKDGYKPQTLEMVVYRPLGTGPFPTLVFNHGSTGAGNRPDWFKLTWTSPEVAEYFARKGWQVLFPQRRGRGLSDGLYDEGFAPDRAMGYSCEPKLALSGFDRATEDLDIVMAQVRTRSDVDTKRLLIGGVSRGGILSVAYAGMRPELFKGVLNFVGGWVGDVCKQADKVNPVLMKRGAGFARPMIWLYGDHDPYYRLAHSRNNFDVFRAAGGLGEFLEFQPAPGRNGHMLHNEPFLWTDAVDKYLAEVEKR